LLNADKYNAIDEGTLLSRVYRKCQASKASYNSKVINDIIFNEDTHIVCIFKDYLIFDDVNEFLKRYYTADESSNRLTKMFDFYTKYSKVFPNYVAVSESKYMFKNIEKKQKLLDDIQNQNPKRNNDYQNVFSDEFMKELNKSISFELDEPAPKDSFLNSYIKNSEKTENNVSYNGAINKLLSDSISFMRAGKPKKNEETEKFSRFKLTSLPHKVCLGNVKRKEIVNKDPINSTDYPPVKLKKPPQPQFSERETVEYNTARAAKLYNYHPPATKLETNKFQVQTSRAPVKQENLSPRSFTKLKPRGNKAPIQFPSQFQATEHSDSHLSGSRISIPSIIDHSAARSITNLKIINKGSLKSFKHHYHTNPNIRQLNKLPLSKINPNSNITPNADLKSFGTPMRASNSINRNVKPILQTERARVSNLDEIAKLYNIGPAGGISKLSVGSYSNKNCIGKKIFDGGHSEMQIIRIKPPSKSPLPNRAIKASNSVIRAKE
jgi:hypothetical protein